MNTTSGNPKGRTVDSQSMKPEERVKAIARNGIVEINPSLKAICYIRTGKEMIRCAENYHEEGSYENAYLLYMRFLTLFVEKFKEHPGYKDLNEADKKLMRSYCKKVLPLAEHIKEGLLQKYDAEYKQYLEESEKLRAKLEEEKRRSEEERNRIGAGSGTNKGDLFAASSYKPSAPPIYDPSVIDRDFKPLPGYNIPGEYDPAASQVSNGVSPNPQFDRTTKPSRLVSPMGSDSLRPVVIPTDIINRFLTIATSNTAKNVETCGILAGKISHNKLIMTHLIIPKQSGTSDSCTTHNEEDIYTIIDQHSLIQLGWIHTHPTQTSFLSSVDLHTHLTYQLMMPESIAIVCAPSKQENHVFTLTPAGIDMLQACTQPGFHPHPPQAEEPFMVAKHAHFDDMRHIIVEDLRNR